MTEQFPGVALMTRDELDEAYDELTTTLNEPGYADRYPTMPAFLAAVQTELEIRQQS